MTIKKLTLSITIVGALLIASIATQNCGAICSPEEASFSKCIEPTLRANCSGSGCHGGEKPAAGLSLEGDFYKSIYKKPAVGNPALSLIEPGKPEKSYLFLKLLSEEQLKKYGQKISGSQMPLERPKLYDSQIELIRAWIEKGAKKD